MVNYFSLFLYTIAIRLYGFAIWVASFWQPKAALWIKGRKSSLYPSITDKDSGQRYWIHCASLGEFEQGKPLIEAIKKKYPNCQIWLTFFSPSGYEIRKNYPIADWVGYIPLDTAHNAKIFIDALQPSAVFFIKYEYWYYHLKKLHQKNIPCYLVSAQFRPEELFFKPHGDFFRQILRFYRHIFVQHQAAADLLASIGITQVTVSGDTRFDRVLDTAHKAIELPIIATFKGKNPVLVAGSTWQADEKLIISAIHHLENTQKNAARLKWIIAPHEIDAAHLHFLRSELETSSTIFSENKHSIITYSEAAAMPLVQQKAALATAQVLIIDSIGILSAIYKYGDYAYIGGGFGRGIHNILEAAVFGLPLFFGTNYQKFQEALDLVALKAAFPICQIADLLALLDRYPRQSDSYDKIKNICQQYVAEKSGAVDKIIQWGV